MKQIEFDYDKVKELYVDKKLSISKCAKELGVNQATLNKYLVREGLKTGSKQSDVPDLMDSLKPKPVIEEKKVEKSKKPSSKKKEKSFTLEDKIAYCNKKYGVGRWRFLDKDELLEMLIEDASFRV